MKNIPGRERKPEQRQESQWPQKLAQNIGQIIAGNKGEEPGRGQVLGDFILRCLNSA